MPSASAKPGRSPVCATMWSELSDWAVLATILVLAFVLRLVFFTGLTGSDDTVYVLRGLETASGLWRPTQNVGQLRYGVNLPIAAFVAAFGVNLVSVHAWSMLCSLSEIALVFLLGLRMWGLRAAGLAALVMAVTPLHVHAGGRALADAPLAMFITLAFVAFYFAERGRVLLYGVAGLAIGFAWWIKPPAIIFAAAFLLYAALTRRWRLRWGWVALGAAAAIALEWAMFGIKFGDPLYAVHASLNAISTEFVQTDAPWGVHAAFYYFRQMFLDGRDMALAPAFALLAVIALVRGKSARNLAGAGYVLLWCLSLLALFSFAPYSFSPFKLIPKQSNYALMFFAPIALLAGFGLSLLRVTVLRWVAVVAVTVLGITLAALPQYQARIRQASLRPAMIYALTHQDLLVYLPNLAVNLMRAERLLQGETDLPLNVRVLSDVLAPNASPGSLATPLVLFRHPLWPEYANGADARLLQQRLPCLHRVERLSVHADAPGRYVVNTLVELRAILPSMLARQLGFTDEFINVSPVEVYRCGA